MHDDERQQEAGSLRENEAPPLHRAVAEGHRRRQRRGAAASVALALLAAWSVLTPAPALAGVGGGGGGSSGNAIWSLAWWTGNPEGPGPYVGPPGGGAGQCIWHDVGGSVSALSNALSESSLPQSFWTVGQSGGHEGIWGVLAWARRHRRPPGSGDHFDLVACPSGSQVPPSGADVEASLPLAQPPGRAPVWLWVFFDTVASPPAGALPPVVDEAFRLVRLPRPVPYTSPSRIGAVEHATVVNLPTWLSVGASIWRTYVATATAGAVTATAWATPVAVLWSAGWRFSAPGEDPEHAVSFAPEVLGLSCPGPGVVYRLSVPYADQSTSCAAVFDEPTFGTWQALRASVEFTVHWAVSGPTGVVGGEGLLAPVSSTAAVPLRVMQIESIIVSG